MKRLRYRQELFCRRFVEGANATQAAISAGYASTSARNAGYRLLQRPEVVRRIATLHREMARQSRDVDVLIGKLEAIYRRAMTAQQCSAAARVIEIQAKLGGGGAAVRASQESVPASVTTTMPPAGSLPDPAND